jgi:hypothetical protein
MRVRITRSNLGPMLGFTIRRLRNARRFVVLGSKFGTGVNSMVLFLAISAGSVLGVYRKCSTILCSWRSIKGRNHCSKEKKSKDSLKSKNKIIKDSLKSKK